MDTALIPTWGALLKFMNSLQQLIPFKFIPSLSLKVDLFDACISLNKKGLLTINSQPFNKNASEHRNSYVERGPI